MSKWEVSKEITLFDDEANRSRLDYMDKMDIMMSDDRNEPENGKALFEELNDFVQFGKTYKFTVTLEEV